jgi:hypothetical protein
MNPRRMWQKQTHQGPWRGKDSRFFPVLRKVGQNWIAIPRLGPRPLKNDCITPHVHASRSGLGESTWQLRSQWSCTRAGAPW